MIKKPQYYQMTSSQFLRDFYRFHCCSRFGFRKEKTDITYCVWHDTKTVLLASTAYAGHSESSVKRCVKDPVTNGCSLSDYADEI